VRNHDHSFLAFFDSFQWKTCNMAVSHMAALGLAHVHLSLSDIKTWDTSRSHKFSHTFSSLVCYSKWPHRLCRSCTPCTVHFLVCPVNYSLRIEALLLLDKPHHMTLMEASDGFGIVNWTVLSKKRNKLTLKPHFLKNCDRSRTKFLKVKTITAMWLITATSTMQSCWHHGSR